MGKMSEVIMGVIMLLISYFVVVNIGLGIGDRFTTSDSLAINQTENPDGYEAQQNLSASFYDNIQFTDILIFIAIAAAALWVLKAFGVLG